MRSAADNYHATTTSTSSSSRQQSVNYSPGFYPTHTGAAPPPATGGPQTSNMATVCLLINPAHSHNSGNAPPTTTCPPTWASQYHTSKPGDSPYISIVAHSSVAATSLHLSTLYTYSQLDTGPMLGVWRTASGGGTWSHSVRSRAAAERKIGADQRPATLAVFTDSRYVNR